MCLRLLNGVTSQNLAPHSSPSRIDAARFGASTGISSLGVLRKRKRWRFSEQSRSQLPGTRLWQRALSHGVWRLLRWANLAAATRSDNLEQARRRLSGR